MERPVVESSEVTDAEKIRLRLSKYEQLCNEQMDKIDYLSEQLRIVRVNPLSALKQTVSFFLLNALSSKLSVLPGKTKRRLARSARKRNPYRNDFLTMMETAGDNDLTKEMIRGRLGLAETVLVVALERDWRVANLLIEALEDTRLSVRLAHDFPDNAEEDLFLVINPKEFERLPAAERLILINERLDFDWKHPFSENEKGSLRCLCVASPTLELIPAFHQAGWPFEQVYYVPVDESLGVLQRHSFAGTKFHILRLLHGIGVLSINEVQRACKDMRLPSARVVLALPEHKERYDRVCQSHIDNGFIFHGLRNVEGWKGCAFSYKFLCAQGLAQNKIPLLICEDDAVLAADFEERFGEIEQFLSKSDVEWDIFSGLLTDLDAGVHVDQIIPLTTGELISVDQFVGAVFTIYNREAMRLIADYDADRQLRAGQRIDRYVGGHRLRVMTAWPPLVGHDVSVHSSISFSGNSGSSGMIERSLAILAKKRQAYCLERGRDML